MTNKFYTFDTTKTENGFRYRVFENISRSQPNENNQYVDSKLLKIGFESTRQRASSKAKKLKMLFTSRLVI